MIWQYGSITIRICTQKAIEYCKMEMYSSKRKYDLVVVGAGLFGLTVARLAADANMSVLVVEKRGHIGGNCWSFKQSGIDIHAYGPHALHTNDKAIWDWFCSFTDFTPCIMSPIANYKGELYSLPFNMYTFQALWGVNTPEEAAQKLDEQRISCANPSNLEQHVLSMVGEDIYEKLIKGYTEKQYGKPCEQLPKSIISRMPLLMTYDTDYNHKKYQGIPTNGWDTFFDSLIDGMQVEIITNINYFDHRNEFESIARQIVFTGPIDEYYDYCFGSLEYRGREFQHQELEIPNYQGCALMNYTDSDIPWLRTIEHKHFIGTISPHTVITREYATSWHPGDDPYYTVNDEENQRRYERYHRLASEENRVIFGGRLGEYRYYAMDDTVKSAKRCMDMLRKRMSQ